MSKSKKPKFDLNWAKAKNLCRLNMEDIRMAKALGISPKGLMKNNPSPSQRWKEPVKYWIRGLYEKRFGGKSPQPAQPNQSPPANPAADSVPADENIPF